LLLRFDPADEGKLKRAAGLRHFDTSDADFPGQLNYPANVAAYQLRLFIMSINADVRGIL